MPPLLASIARRYDMLMRWPLLPALAATLDYTRFDADVIFRCLPAMIRYYFIFSQMFSLFAACFVCHATPSPRFSILRHATAATPVAHAYA